MNLYFKNIKKYLLAFSPLPPFSVGSCAVCQTLGFPGQVSDPPLFRVNHQRWGNSNVVPAPEELDLDTTHQKPQTQVITQKKCQHTGNSQKLLAKQTKRNS